MNDFVRTHGDSAKFVEWSGVEWSGVEWSWGHVCFTILNCERPSLSLSLAHSPFSSLNMFIFLSLSLTFSLSLSRPSRLASRSYSISTVELLCCVLS